MIATFVTTYRGSILTGKLKEKEEEKEKEKKRRKENINKKKQNTEILTRYERKRIRIGC